MNNQTTRRRAALTGSSNATEESSVKRHVELGIVVDDQSIVAAKF